MMHVGYVREITRYPVKSMAGIATESAILGWHGLEGDRRFAFRRTGANDGFPWLSASKLPELLLYQPVGLDESTGEPLPTHVRNPSGSRLELHSAELISEITGRFGNAVELMQLKHGIFDEAPISVVGNTGEPGSSTACTTTWGACTATVLSSNWHARTRSVASRVMIGRARRIRTRS